MPEFAGLSAPNPHNSDRFTVMMPHERAGPSAAKTTSPALASVRHGCGAWATRHFRLAMPLMTGHSRERFRLTPMNGRIIGEDEAILFGLRTTPRFARRLHAL